MHLNYEMDAFGNRIPGSPTWPPIDSPGPKEHLTGKMYDEDTGLFYFHARWYDPEVGRFVSGTGSPSLARRPYIFARNAPPNFVEPDGEKPISAHSALDNGPMVASPDLTRDTVDLGCPWCTPEYIIPRSPGTGRMLFPGEGPGTMPPDYSAEDYYKTEQERGLWLRFSIWLRVEGCCWCREFEKCMDGKLWDLNPPSEREWTVFWASSTGGALGGIAAGKCAGASYLVATGWGLVGAGIGTIYGGGILAWHDIIECDMEARWQCGHWPYNWEFSDEK
jgi:RHS repeat-associated protein